MYIKIPKVSRFSDFRFFFLIRHIIKDLRERPLGEVKVRIEDAQMTGPEAHLLAFPLLVPAADLDTPSLRAIRRVSNRVELLCDRKTECTLGNTTKAFPKITFVYLHTSLRKMI